MGNDVMEALDIGGNNIDENGINALSEALKGNKTLRTLELGYNPIGEKGAAQLSNTLKYDVQVLFNNNLVHKTLNYITLQLHPLTHLP